MTPFLCNLSKTRIGQHFLDLDIVDLTGGWGSDAELQREQIGLG